MSMLQDILDWSVAEGDLPFVVGLVGDRNGVCCSGSASEASPAGRAAEDTLFRIFSMSTSIFATAATILVDRGKLNADTSAEDFVRKPTCQRQDRSNADVPKQNPLPPPAPFSLEWSPSTRN
ncbi:serine hydrolase [Mesorhizobium sophorae]|uniref:serine hydrolase n=1 Tax=Mesorhizobium sophorae TaxID=1300294 RepID=UPI000BA34775|nr:serine hydrolase [Mesorhizobium sophorae]